MPDTNIFDLTQIYNFAVSAGEIGIFHYFNNCYFQITNNPKCIYWQYCLSNE